MRSILFNSLKILVGILLIVMLIFTSVNGFFFIVNEFGGPVCQEQTYVV